MTTKNYILSIKKEIDTYKNLDEYKKFLEEQRTITERINIVLLDIKDINEVIENDDEKTILMNDINIEMEFLNNRYKQSKKECMDYVLSLSPKFSLFKERYEGLFEKFVYNDIDDAVLHHCLDTFNKVQSGELDLETGKELGYYKYHKK